MEVFKKINVDFDYMKLRNDVNHVYHTITEIFVLQLPNQIVMNGQMVSLVKLM